MGLRKMHLISLIAGAIVMWDQSLLVETASDQGDREASRVSSPRLPPGIVIPLPYVYPEYVDPRGQMTAAPSTTENNRTDQTPSLSDIILENVRQTMLISSPIKEFVPIMHKNITKKITTQGENWNVTSAMRIMISNDNNDAPIVEQMMNTKPDEEINRQVGEKLNRFSSRLKTSTTQSMKQNFVKTTATSTTPIPTYMNDANDTSSALLNNKSTIQGKSRNVTSAMRIMMSYDNDDEPSVEQMISSKPEEIKYQFGERLNRLSSRLRTSTAHSMQQNFIKTSTPSTTSITTCTNDAYDTSSSSLNNNLPLCLQPGPTKIVPAKAPINGTRHGDNVTLRRRPVSRMRKVAIRRVRPNAENAITTHRLVRRLRVKNGQSGVGMQEEKPEKNEETETLSRQ